MNKVLAKVVVGLTFLLLPVLVSCLIMVNARADEPKTPEPSWNGKTMEQVLDKFGPPELKFDMGKKQWFSYTEIQSKVNTFNGHVTTYRCRTIFKFDGDTVVYVTKIGCLN